MEKSPKILLISSSIHQKGNSYLALKEAERGVLTRGGEVEWLHLNEYFMADGTTKGEMPKAVFRVKQADGIIWGTPVYFGAWNSLSQEFYQMLKGEYDYKRFSLYKKVVGFVAVGAKRNGGQETTITFASWDLMGLGACVVNDGYPVSQFGGTCVGGSIGDVRNDKEGLEMCFNLGKRVAETAMIIQNGDLRKTEAKIFKWRPDGRYGRCRGCAECPSRTAIAGNLDYKCKYYDDALQEVHKEIMKAEGIMPFIYDLRFFERTRYLRRDNYRLTYHVAMMPEPKWIPLFIKQNAILCGREYFYQYVDLVATGREKLTLEKQIYEPIGYKRIY